MAIDRSIIYYLKWDDGLYSVWFVGDYDPIYRDLSQERFDNLCEFFPYAKFIDVKSIIKRGEIK